jgi:transcriptional regulator with XRE-family HTH domain
MTRLKYERKARRLSQQALARDVQLNQPEISLIERGRMIPTAEQLSRLSVVLNVPASELLKDVVILVEARPA